MKLKWLISLLALLPCHTFANDDIDTNTRDQTICATKTFANALAQSANNVKESDSENTIQQWIHQVFSDKNVLTNVLTCPEFNGFDDNEAVKFMPIKYTFPGGREIIVNYETQPKILKQRVSLGQKRSVSDLDPNPRVGDPNGDSIWTNTDPAWYGIMVVESGALDEFVGPDKNNTISLNYIRNNIDRLYPKQSACTSKSPVNLNKNMDNDSLNIAMHTTIGMNDDPNDYYVAGDVDLRWITYLEIGLDVAITVATMGTGTAVTAAAKSVRASRALKNLSHSIDVLRQTDAVKDFIIQGRKVAQLTDELNAIDKTVDAAKYASKLDELNDAKKTLETIEQGDDVKKYVQATDQLRDVKKYASNLNAIKIQRGNVIARASRAVRSFRALGTGNKVINKAAKTARASMKSGKVRDWLFHSTMQNAGMLGRMAQDTSIIYGAIKFVGNMYDYTETSTGEFTSGLDFAPLLLLSADNIEGQENVVNHGMWLMWAGNSVDAADDDAAYLQAIDFATKFHQDLTEHQQDTNTPCNLDIYVVRPILRNPGTANTELYYLIMNDKPWTTNYDKK